MSQKSVALRAAFLFVAAGAVSLLFGGAALGQKAAVTADQIIEALSPPPLTRSLTGPSQPPISEADRTFVNGLRGLTRSLSASERERVTKIVQEQKSPNVNLEVYFDFDSAAITPKAEPLLAELAEALRRGSQLQGALMVLSGHTDARGTEDYNQGLSERRAEAVRKHLIEKYNVPAQNISTAGYGKKTLKNTTEPYAAENRRVLIVNLQSAVEARR